MSINDNLMSTKKSMSGFLQLFPPFLMANNLAQNLDFSHLKKLFVLLVLVYVLDDLRSVKPSLNKDFLVCTILAALKEKKMNLI